MYGSVHNNPTSAAENDGWSSASQAQQPQWKKDACILAMIAGGMAGLAGLLGGYVVFMRNHSHGGINSGGSTSRSAQRLGVASAASIQGKVTPKKPRHEVPKDAEAEAKEKESDMNRRFLTGQDDIYDHVHTNIGYFDGKEHGL